MLTSLPNYGMRTSSNMRFLIVNREFYNEWALFSNANRRVLLHPQTKLDRSTPGYNIQAISLLACLNGPVLLSIGNVFNQQMHGE